MLPLPPIEDLLSLFDYEGSTGLLRWKRSPNWAIPPGQIAGRPNKKGYIEVSIAGVTYKAHRIIWAISTGRDPAPLEIDHRDRCRSNNRLGNLRLATRKLNNENISTPITNSSGKRGVSFNSEKGKWHAYVYDFKRRINLGFYAKFEDAVAARERGEEIYAGITPEGQQS